MKFHYIQWNKWLLEELTFINFEIWHQSKIWHQSASLSQTNVITNVNNNVFKDIPMFSTSRDWTPLALARTPGHGAEHRLESWPTYPWGLWFHLSEPSLWQLVPNVQPEGRACGHIRDTCSLKVYLYRTVQTMHNYIWVVIALHWVFLKKMCHLRPVVADSYVTVTASNYPVCVEYGYHSLVGLDEADDRQQG